MIEMDGAHRRGSRGIATFCAPLLAELPRSEQRRWGETYVEGLVELTGRKSIPKMAERLVDARTARQSLQQFVNQSPWPWEPVRQRLAELWQRTARPQVWVVEELALPKTGPSSVGVATQYVHSLQRSLHCQLALAVFMVGSSIAGPANWRLMLPRHWTEEPHRRANAGLPDDEQRRGRWEYVFDMLDEIVADWQLPPRPVVIDARTGSAVSELIDGLEARGLRYLVRVTSSASSAALPERAGRRLVVDRRAGAGMPPSTWLTNLPGPPAQILLLAGAARLSGGAARQLFQEHGLNHFQGRSFRGWHHHVTMVSIAHAFRVLPLGPARHVSEVTDRRVSA